EVREAVAARYGPEVIRDGAVDRPAVAERAFATDEERAWLEGVLWPLVGARMASWREQLERRNPPPPAAIVEVPLLFEAGMEGLFDATIAVLADERLRAQRAGSRGHLALEQRAARQLTQAEKAHRATYVVLNDGTLEQMQARLSVILDMLQR
ncbi:MAG: dephospho-CoA kinase, partial [Solirubrobacterales bacterium]|nr:dephospho-CoA kinase [Solirubrobacterales bacterium]